MLIISHDMMSVISDLSLLMNQYWNLRTQVCELRFVVKHATFAVYGYGPMLTNVMAILRKPVEFSYE